MHRRPRSLRVGWPPSDAKACVLPADACAFMREMRLESIALFGGLRCEPATLPLFCGPSLTELDADLAGDEPLLALQVLNLPSLTKLGALRPRSAEAIAVLAQFSTLRSLTLTLPKWHDDALGSALKSLTALTDFDLTSWLFEARMLHWLKVLPALSALQLAFDVWYDDASAALSELRLRKLVLKAIGKNTDDVTIQDCSFAAMPSLTYLDMSDVPVGGQSLTDSVAGLTCHPACLRVGLNHSLLRPQPLAL
jgi:hypothetical protein